MSVIANNMRSIYTDALFNRCVLKADIRQQTPGELLGETW